jgi:hypothetical protein
LSANKALLLQIVVGSVMRKSTEGDIDTVAREMMKTLENEREKQTVTVTTPVAIDAKMRMKGLVLSNMMILVVTTITARTGTGTWKPLRAAPTLGGRLWGLSD